MARHGAVRSLGTFNTRRFHTLGCLSVVLAQTTRRAGCRRSVTPSHQGRPSTHWTYFARCNYSALILVAVLASNTRLATVRCSYAVFTLVLTFTACSTRCSEPSGGLPRCAFCTNFCYHYFTDGTSRTNVCSIRDAIRPRCCWHSRRRALALVLFATAFSNVILVFCCLATFTSYR